MAKPPAGAEVPPAIQAAFAPYLPRQAPAVAVSRAANAAVAATRFRGRAAGEIVVSSKAAVALPDASRATWRYSTPRLLGL